LAERGKNKGKRKKAMKALFMAGEEGIANTTRGKSFFSYACSMLGSVFHKHGKI
jgi:hypothetical protein